MSPLCGLPGLPHPASGLIQGTDTTIVTSKGVRVSGCPGVRAGFLEYARLAFGGIATRAGLPAIQRSKLRAAWLREAKPDLARAFSHQYAGACPYNPCLTSIVLKCLLDGSRLRPRKLSAQKFADGDHFERESGDGWTPPVCF